MSACEITVTRPSRTVVVTPVQRVVEVQAPQRVIEVQAPQRVVEVQPRVRQIEIAARGLRGEMGVQGPAGPAGTPGGTVQPISFSYGDAPGAVYTPSAAGTITVARVVIETPFNGTAPSLQLGTLASPGAAMAATDNDPTSSGEYEVTADLHLAAGEPLRITVTPDGSTAGSGRIYLTFIPD